MQKKVTVIMMIVALLVEVVSVMPENTQAAAKKISLAKTANVIVGKTVKIRLKNNRKKVMWNVTKGKKLIKIAKKSKAYVTVRGVRKGTAKIQAVVGNKKYTCTVKVSAEKKQQTSQPTTPSQPPMSSQPPAPTETPIATPKVRTIVYDGTNINEIKNAGEPVDVVVKEGVGYIGSLAFRNCFWVKSITLANSVEYIGYKAFAACASLESITIPEGVMSIGAEAFSSCGDLKSITIPDSVTEIADNAFGFSGVTSITWKGTTYSSDEAFFTAFNQAFDGNM